ncbi:MAG TPA: hypothetical protein VJ906_02345 [Roseovarius sp.]|nr:hypothetical protein [Roseovarius sp.]
MTQDDSKTPTLKEALQQPCKFRDMTLAMEPMPNYSSTPDGPNGTPIALILDDCQEEHRFPMAEGNVDMDERRAGGLQPALSVMCLFYSAGHMPQCVRIAEYKRNKGGADVAHYRKGMLRCP